MIWLKRLAMLAFVLGSFGLLWREVHHSPVKVKKQWFVSNLKQLKGKTTHLRRKQQHLRRQIVGLQYDQRVIENEIREQLDFKRKGELTLVLPSR
jgi:cell division protein FtsB